MAANMPFGKYEGERVASLPKGYLQWLHDETDLYGWLKEAVDAALKGQPYARPKPTKAVQPLELDEAVHRIVKPAPEE